MVELKTWLREVNDDTPISKLSIPGTHNSAALHTALPSVQCQGESITSQLEHGVRFLDIRAAKLFLKEGDAAKDLQVIHGKFPVRIPFPLKLTSVLDEVYDFVSNNPSEFVIVSLKQEGSDDWNNDQDEFGNLIWDKYVNNHKDKWYLNTDIPRVRDARGKVILFRRFGVKNENRAREFGFPASSWKYNTTEDDRGSFVVQDFCEMSSAEDVDKKVGYVKDLATKAVQYNLTDNQPKLFVNFASGSNFFNTDCWPQKVAQQVTKLEVDKSFNRGAGIIIFDYIESDDWKLAKELVEKNF